MFACWFSRESISLQEGCDAWIDTVARKEKEEQLKAQREARDEESAGAIPMQVLAVCLSVCLPVRLSGCQHLCLVCSLAVHLSLVNFG